jgi:glycogen synthase
VRGSPDVRRLTIWLAPSAFWPHVGGIEQITFDLANVLSAHGHDVLVVTNRYPLDLPEQEALNFGSVHRIPFTTPAMSAASAARHVANIRRIQRALSDLPPPDIIHVHGASSQLGPMLQMARRHSAPLILTTHGEIVADAHRVFQRSLYLRWLLRRAARRATLTAPTAWTLDAGAWLAPELAQAQVIPNGIWTDRWDAGPLPETRVVMAWGRHEWEKGFDLLLDAWPLVLDEVSDAQLVLAGVGTQTDALRSRSVANTEFPGALGHDDVLQRLRGSRVVAVPSRIEAFGIVALEALAAGRNLVHSGRGGLSEATGGFGAVADPENPRDFAEALVRALRTAQPSAKDVVMRRSWDVIGRQYLALYEEALRRPL